jgi:molybdenum cofactor guanylyltransferase
VPKDAAASSVLPPSNCAFSAVLLAGGKSSRMGRDKAGVIVAGQSLWQRQLSTLHALHPAELFVSGKSDGPYASSDISVVTDITPDRGPLSGLEASLHYAAHPLLLVLAIDLPAMTAEFLSRLLREVSSERGCVPCIDGWFEPLAAVYPRHSLPLVQKCLRGEDFSMQSFVRQAISSNLVTSWTIPEEDTPLFRNVNTPIDLSPDENL